MIGDELAVEQGEPAEAEPRHEPGECDLRRVCTTGEHAFAEECAAQTDAVEAAGERVAVPAFDRMGVTGIVERAIGLLDHRIDPGFRPVGAGADDIGERGIARHTEAIGAHCLAQRASEAEAIER